MALVVAGEQDAAASFRAFYAAEYADLARYAWRLTGDVDTANDIAQDAMGRTFARWRSVDEPRAYAFRIATNLARKAWRRRAEHALAVAHLAGELGTTVESPEGAAWVRDAVRAMPSRLRDVVLLHYFADLRVEDVAAATGRPVGTVKRQLAEARSTLAVALRDEITPTGAQR